MAKQLLPDTRPRPILARGELLAEDVDKVGGGAPPWHPRTQEEAAVFLRPQAERVVNEIAALPADLRGPHVVVEAKVLPNYLASSHYPEELLRAVNLYSVGTRQSRGIYRTKKRTRENEPTKTYLLAGPDGSVRALATLINAGPSYAMRGPWDRIRELDTLSLPSPDVVLRGTHADAGDGELVTWEAVLNPIGVFDHDRSNLTEETIERFIRHVESVGGEVDRDFVRTVDGLTFLPVALTVVDAPKAARFNALRAMRPMPRVRDLDVMVRGADIWPASITTPKPTQVPPSRPLTDEKVAVFDGGVELGDRWLSPYVRLHDLTTTPPHPKGIRHGTIITNAVLYGYAAIANVQPSPMVTVDHYRILPAPPIGTVDSQFYWVLDRIIERSVADGHKIVNLSLGPPKCVDEDSEPHRWTAELDALAHSHGILFISAAGNNGSRTDCRVQVPADMANGLSVGACTSRDEGKLLQRAQYSALGPGRPGQRVVPVGVGFGGSMLDAEPFRGRGPHGNHVEEEGTSFGTPLTTHGAAGLRAMLGGSNGSPYLAGAPRPDMLRAYGAHFAHGRRGTVQDERHVGYGRLRESYAEVWDCGPSTVTVVYDLKLRRNQLVAILFPMPDGVPSDVMLGIDFTVCYTSAVQPAHAADYTRFGLEMTFRPHDRMYSVSDPKTKKIVVPKLDVQKDSAELARLLAAGKKLSAHPISRSGGRRSKWEGDQRDAGKWETLVRTNLRVRARDLHAPRLDIEFLARDGARLVRDQVQDLPATVLVTIRAPQGTAIYDHVRQQLPVLAPVTPLVVLPRVQVSTPGTADG